MQTNKSHAPTYSESLRSAVILAILMFGFSALVASAAGDPQLVVESADADLNAGTLTIRGDFSQQFGVKQLVVQLDGVVLAIDSVSPTEIVALLPDPLMLGAQRLAVGFVEEGNPSPNQFLSLLDVTMGVGDSFEAECPAGSALKSMDIDGQPGFVCTDELALDTELAQEVADRKAGDSGLQSQITTNANSIAANAGNIATNTSNIASNTSNIATNASTINVLKGFQASCPTGEVLSMIDLDGTPGFTCEAVSESQRFETFAVSQDSSCDCHPSCEVKRCCCKDGDGNVVAGCLSPDFKEVCNNPVCGSSRDSCLAYGSCTTPAQPVSCPNLGGTQEQSQLVSCLKGSFAGGDTCSGEGGTASCGPAPMAENYNCDCSAIPVFGCAVACNRTLALRSYPVTAPSSQAMCGKIE